MTEVTTAPAAAAAPVAISTQQAATMLAERRAASAAETNKPNPSDAARILNAAKAAKALQRTTEAATAVQPSQEEGNETEDESNPIGSDTPGDETANAEHSEDQAEQQDETQDDAGLIDLGEGVKVTKEQVRESFMLKADYTRKRQADSEAAKQIEAKFSQRLSDLDKTIASLEPLTGNNKPKTMRDFIAEHGVEEGLPLYHEHQRRVEAAKQLAHHKRSELQAEARAKAEQDCDQHLIENYRKEWADPQKYEAAQVAISKHARSLGFTSEQIHALGVMPGALIALNDSLELKALKEKGGEIKRTIADKPKVIRPGAKVSAQAGAQSQAQSARATLKSSGSLSDAVAYLQAQRKARG